MFFFLRKKKFSSVTYIVGPLFHSLKVVYIYIYMLKSMKTKVFLFFAFALCVSPLLRLFRHSKVCLLTYYVTDVTLITIIMAPVIQSARAISVISSH